MNRFERRKLKRNIYKHGNTIMYTAIFVMASIITIAAAANRRDDITYVDDTQMASTVREAVDIKNSDNPKVAATETITETEVTEEVTTIEETTEVQTEAQTSEQETLKVKIIADSLNIRQEASTDSEAIGSAMMNQEFEVISQNGEWIKIEFDGKSGFIKAEFTKVIE